MRVLVVDESTARAGILRDGLERAGHEVTASLGSPTALLKAIEKLAPDVVVIDTDSPSREVLEHLAAVSEHAPRPVVMFAADGAPETIREALRAGVSAYVVDGFDPARVQAIIDGAVARFEDRRLINRAKGVLMRMRGLDEEAAYAFMRKAAMDRKMKLAKLAQGLIDAADLLVHEAR